MCISQVSSWRQAPIILSMWTAKLWSLCGEEWRITQHVLFLMKLRWAVVLAICVYDMICFGRQNKYFLVLTHFGHYSINQHVHWWWSLWRETASWVCCRKSGMALFSLADRFWNKQVDVICLLQWFPNSGHDPDRVKVWGRFMKWCDI